ncbi:hypothetical protein Tco_0960214 [Tanacetum coccineum]
MSTDIVKLDLFDGGSFKRWQKKPWLNPMNVSSSEMTISFDVATSSMLCRIQSWTYIKIILVLGNFGKLSRNASSRKTQQVRNLLFSNLTYNIGRYLAQNKYAKVIGNLMYAMTCTRPDIAYAKTMDYSLEYSRESSVLEGYTDASWITDQEDYASTSEWIFTVGGCSVLGIKETELFNRLYYGRRVCGIGVMLQRSRTATGLVNKHTLMAETYAANLCAL